MSKHGQKLRLCAAHMPLIRRSITEAGLEATSPGMTRIAEQVAPYKDVSQRFGLVHEQYARLAHAPLYFLSRDMTTLAVDTALHGGAPKETVIPSENGIIGFDGGVHFDGMPPELTDISFVCWDNASKWGVEHPGWFYLDIITCSNSRAAHDTPLWKGRAGVPEFVPIDPSAVGIGKTGEQMTAEAFNANAGWVRVWREIIRAVFALVDVPTVTRTRDYKTHPLDRVPRKYDPDLPSNRVRLVDVQENLTEPGGRDGDQADTRDGQRREYAYRFIVRGFYRQQPYGPGRKLRRRQWIPPFVKGPADKPLRVKDTVNILRGTVRQEGQQEHE